MPKHKYKISLPLQRKGAVRPRATPEQVLRNLRGRSCALYMDGGWWNSKAPNQKTTYLIDSELLTPFEASILQQQYIETTDIYQITTKDIMAHQQVRKSNNGKGVSRPDWSFKPPGERPVPVHKRAQIKMVTEYWSGSRIATFINDPEWQVAKVYDKFALATRSTQRWFVAQNRGDLFEVTVNSKHKMLNIVNNIPVQDI